MPTMPRSAPTAAPHADTTPRGAYALPACSGPPSVTEGFP